jgi:serine/threonine protein kinase
MHSRRGQQIGNYRLVQLLGQGGFAEVYLATHIHLNSSVAFKLLQGQLRSQDVQAFLGEAQTIAVLKHPGIVRVLDFGFEQAQPFLVMEYIPGGTLRDRYPEGTPVVLATVVSYVHQVASALAYAHANRVIHRDVKPENMLIDADGKILLTDFGIAATAHRTASMKTLDSIGTVPYMAPEQIKGRPRPASDQYALAIVVYEWLCGERPFSGNASIEIAMKHISLDPPSLRAKGIAIPAKVERVILKALNKNPQQRFPDILAFAQALEQAALSTNRNILSTLPFFSQRSALPPTRPVPQTSILTPTQPAPSPHSHKTQRVTEIAAEEEMLLTYIRSLPPGSSYDEAKEAGEAMESIIRNHQHFFRQLENKGRIIRAFDEALERACNAIRGHNSRRVLINSKAEFLNIFGYYEEMLLTYIRYLPPDSSYDESKAAQEAMEAIIKSHARYFRHSGYKRMILRAFDEALEKACNAIGGHNSRRVLAANKAEFLSLFSHKGRTEMWL